MFTRFINYANVRFIDSDFAVSIVVYEEDFEYSNDTLLAPPVQNNPPNKYFNNYFPNYDNTYGKNYFIYSFQN
jgi:hypothetical protein